MYRLLLTLILLVPLNILAEAPPPPEPVPDAPPPVPTGVDPAEEFEPEVKITKRSESTIYEYSIKGQVYMVKIVPRVGYPYYLIDTDGDGSLESRYNKLEPELVVPNWMIYRW
ncbi:MAG: DUF2782 domain-containing protein [Gammaproteobacteria bacterium]|jgi:hypothetical protein|nr:DUF2782 domain-containing protein [Gammaproteobacteria bacterium]